MEVRPQDNWPQGEVVCFRHRSEVLRDNIWSDPAERDFNVYLPPGYSESGRAYAALWDFAAFTNAGPGHLNWKNQGENLPQRLDRLIGCGEMPPVVVPMPDCYSSLGGNQYVNSASVGRYADYVVDELVPFLSNQVNVVGHRDGRGAFGKSSGGYGALVHAMYYPETWGGLASHAGDIGFEWVYRPEFPRAAAVLSAFNGDHIRFLKKFWRNKYPGSPDYSTLMTLAMAASYDPGDSQETAIQLPFDLHTCELDMNRWNRWLAHDPLNLLESYAEQLASLHMLYIDVGSRDQYNIQYGTRAFIRRLEKSGIGHHFEEFDGTHSGMDWRLDISLPMLAKALYAACEAGEPVDR
ncbi:MAG: alpha/beta hydrolase-fold protein [Lysobacterales bacterium]